MNRPIVTRVAAAILLASMAVASPAGAAGDLLYHYRTADVGALKGYDGQPYWRVLGECAGVHGALASRYQATGRSREFEQAKSRGVAFLRAAMQQARADRGLNEAEALSLTSASADNGRADGTSLLSKTPVSKFSHEQLIDLLCTQVSDRHADALRRQRR